MYEDWQLDEKFHVESGEDFYNSLNPEEQDFVLSTMVPCSNCGEFRPKSDLDIKRTTRCGLCNESDEHARRRGMSQEASNTTGFLAGLVKELRELTDK